MRPKKPKTKEKKQCIDHSWVIQEIMIDTNGWIVAVRLKCQFCEECYPWFKPEELNWEYRS